jgi:hypothetical protein
MKKYFISYWKTLKIGGKKNDAGPKNCLVEMWNVNVHYWKTPNVNKESKHMQVVHV